MPSYPTPAAVRVPVGSPPLLKNLKALVLGRSLAPIMDTVRVPAISALLIVLTGAIGAWLRQPWLFAGLGPTVLMVASSPGHETTRFRAVVVGHLAALGCGYLALMLLNATGAPTMLASATIAYPRVWASALALALLALLQPQLRAYHPPAAATALLVTMGAYRMTGRTPLALMFGVLAVAIGAELLQRMAPRRGR